MPDRAPPSPVGVCHSLSLRQIGISITDRQIGISIRRALRESREFSLRRRVFRIRASVFRGMTGHRHRCEGRHGPFRGVKTHEKCQLEGGLADVELGRFGRSSWSSLLVEVVQDSADDRRLGDESENFHLGGTSTTGQRVHFVDTVNEFDPSLAQSASWRRSFIALVLVFRGVVVSELLRTNAIGVGSVEIGRDVCWGRGCG